MLKAVLGCLYIHLQPLWRKLVTGNVLEIPESRFYTIEEN